MEKSTLRPASGRLLAVWASVALIAGGLTACGGDSEATPTDAPAPAAGTAPPPASAPGTAPAPAVVAARTCELPDFYATALAQVNAFRSAPRSCGTSGNFAAAGPLVWNDKLTATAAGHSLDMATQNYFSHTSLDGRTVPDRMRAAGYTWRGYGENISAGRSTVASTITGWQDSPGHCANLMNPGFVEIGLACVRRTASGGYGTYWTMNLGKP